MRVELKEKEKAFVKDQLLRDQELIKLMEVREKEMEQKLLHKAEAFGYLYKEHQKEIIATIQKRDEELESILNYREKLWTDSINLVNQNFVKVYQAQGEFEQSLNSIRQRQSEPIKQNIIMQEWYLFDRNREGSTTKPEPSIHEFTPLNASYKFEAVNLKPSRSPIERRDNSLFIPHSFYLLCHSFSIL